MSGKGLKGDFAQALPSPGGALGASGYTNATALSTIIATKSKARYASE